MVGTNSSRRKKTINFFIYTRMLTIKRKIEEFNRLFQNNQCWDLDLLKNYLIRAEVRFSAQDVRKMWGRGLKTLSKQPDKNLNMYISMPFCLDNKCAYCRHQSLIASSSVIDLYIIYLINSLKYYKDIFKNFVFNNLYIGGGTPSILTNKQLQIILNEIFNDYDFDPSGEKTFECNPNTINLEKLMIVKNFGFNRISIGVQSLDEKVLSSAKRNNQSYNDVQNAIVNAQTCNFPVINVDLMLGLANQTLESLVKTCLQIIKFRPDNMFIYKYKPQEGHYGNYIKQSQDKYFKRLNNFCQRFSVVLKSDKKVNSVYFVTENDNFFRLRLKTGPRIKISTPYVLYGDRPFNYVFGVGQFAISKIYSIFQGEELSKNFFFKPRLKNIRGSFVSQTDEMKSYILNSLDRYDSVINKTEFEKNFGQDISLSFKGELEYFQNNNLLVLDNERVIFKFKTPKEKFLAAFLFI